MKHIDQYLSKLTSEAGLAYFYRRFSGWHEGTGDKFMSIRWFSDSLTKMIESGEDEDVFIIMDRYSSVGAVPFVTGNSFSDCVNKLDEILRKVFEKNLLDEMDDLYIRVQDQIAKKYQPNVDEDDLYKDLRTFKEKLNSN